MPVSKKYHGLYTTAPWLWQSQIPHQEAIKIIMYPSMSLDGRGKEERTRDAPAEKIDGRI